MTTARKNMPSFFQQVSYELCALTCWCEDVLARTEENPIGYTNFKMEIKTTSREFQQ